MPTPRKAGRFGGNAGHHQRIMANLATELLRHGRIQTTHAKAKAVQPLAERMVTFAKRGDVASRRQVRKVIRDADVLHHLFSEVGPANADRAGGYTRVLKLGPRKGDAAPMALIELVEQGDGAGRPERGAEAPRRRWGLRRQERPTQPAAPAQPAAEPAGETAGTSPEPETADDAAPGASEPAEAKATFLDPVAEDDEDTEGPQVDPAEVEARLGAEAATEEAGAARPSEDDADEESAGSGEESAGTGEDAEASGQDAASEESADGDDDTGRA